MQRIGIKRLGEFTILIISNRIILRHTCNNNRCRQYRTITTLSAPTFKYSSLTQRISIPSGTQATKTTNPLPIARVLTGD
jgi:hypothetical protein